MSTNEEFINIVGSMAQKDMKYSCVLASVTTAQAILESGWGKSGLAKKGFNLFGIKGSYNGQSVRTLTKECYNGEWCTVKANFRKYPSYQESISDHSGMFNRMSRYHNIVGCNDYEKVCEYLQQDGYATDPDYPGKLISLIEKYNLCRFDEIKEEHTGSSIVEYLESIGQDSSFQARKNLAKKYRLAGYAGTSEQNTRLLSLIRGA